VPRKLACASQLSVHEASLETLNSKLERDGRAKTREADKSQGREAIKLYLAERKAVWAASGAPSRFKTIVRKIRGRDTTEEVVERVMEEADELLESLVEMTEKAGKAVDEEDQCGCTVGYLRIMNS
jgi:hypothetical protein